MAVLEKNEAFFACAAAGYRAVGISTMLLFASGATASQIDPAIVPAAPKTPMRTHGKDTTSASPADFWRRVTAKDIQNKNKRYLEHVQWRPIILS